MLMQRTTEAERSWLVRQNPYTILSPRALDVLFRELKDLKEDCQRLEAESIASERSMPTVYV